MLSSEIICNIILQKGHTLEYILNHAPPPVPRPDLEMLPAGDQTEIGDETGGRKAGLTVPQGREGST